MFLRQKSGKAFTLFYAADLHGSETCFRKFLNAAEFYRADALVLGGDLSGKALIPIVPTASGSFEAHLIGRTESARDEDDVARLEASIRFNGFYPFRCTLEELADLERSEALRERRFEEIIGREVERWMALADERLARSGVPCVIIPGNDDGPFVERLIERSTLVTSGEERVVELGPYQVLSFGYSNPTPWHSPRELPEQAIAERLAAVAGELEPNRPTIFNIHVPPFGTRIDDAPEITSALELVGGANARMVPVGSHAVRQTLERVQPMLGLHGHIHESRGTARVGRTTCVNPGSEYNVGILRGALIRLRGSEVENVQFVAA